MGLKKKDLGLPHYDAASERQRRDGMCWRNEDEFYNGGTPFKLDRRDHRGVMVTILADNYYGYCKKEVKTQISYAANLFGMCEEEHAGGALAFPAYVLGQQFYAGRTVLTKQVTFEQAMQWLGDRIEVKPERYAVDRQFPDIFYVPENADFSVLEGRIRWQLPQRRIAPAHAARGRGLCAAVGHQDPSGKANRRHGVASGGFARRWHPVPQTMHRFGRRQIGNIQIDRHHHAERPGLCHAISSAISKQVAEILAKDFSTIYKRPTHGSRAQRPILSTERSLGSVIKLMTPSPEYTDQYNEWLATIPQTVRQLLITLKRYYQPEWGDDWRQHFSVDRINGLPGP